MAKWLIIGLIVLILIVGGVIYYMSGNSKVYDSAPIAPSSSSYSSVNTSLVTVENTSATSSLGSPNSFAVNIQGFAFSTLALNVKVGDTVIWTNLDSVAHTVTSDSGSELNSELLSKGQTYSHTFTSAGTYDYYCKPHPRMKAKIIVS